MLKKIFFQISPSWGIPGYATVVTNPGKQTVAIIQSAVDERMHELNRCLEGK